MLSRECLVPSYYFLLLSIYINEHIMKVLQRLLMAHLSKQVNTFQDPPNHPGAGVKDAIIYLLQRAHSHLVNADSTVRIMFFDFSSFFTVKPEVLFVKYRWMPP